MRAGVITLVLCLSAATGAAQQPPVTPTQPADAPVREPALRRHRLTMSGGLSWLGGYPLGGNAATLRRNETGTTSPSAFTLFRADASMEQAPSYEARVGYALTRELAIELGGSYAKPQLALNVTSDAEAEPIVLSDEDLSQYTVDGSVVWQIPSIRLGRHIRPYVTAGGGYLRQLYADRTVVETGRIMHFGGGIRYWLIGGDTTRRPLGVRLETRMQMRTGGVDLESKTRTYPVFNIFGFFGF